MYDVCYSLSLFEWPFSQITLHSKSKLGLGAEFVCLALARKSVLETSKPYSRSREYEKGIATDVARGSVMILFWK